MYNLEDYIISTDQDLIKLVIDGDSIAFEHLFNRYRNSIHQLYMQRTGGKSDDTDDLLQETFIKVYLNIHKYNPEFTFGQWVYTIARNTFIDYTRRRKDKHISIDSPSTRPNEISPASSSPSPEQRLIIDQNRDQLESLMNMMTPRYRELIELRFFREFSYEEISIQLTLPMGTVKTQIHRAREQLCRYILNSKETLL